METVNEKLKELMKDAVSDADLSGEDIPAIDLYMDQIISLVAERNAEGSARYADRVLTKTMINNYSKDGLIKPIKGKKYTREQILQMLFIYTLKSTLSIGEVKRLMYGVYREVPGFDGEALGSCYDRFMELKESNRKESLRVAEELMEQSGLDPEKNEDYFLTVLGLVSMSAYLKSIAQAMLENGYTDPDLEETARRGTDHVDKRLHDEQERVRKTEQKEKKKNKTNAEKTEETEKDDKVSAKEEELS